ncbi:chromate transporter [Caldalkalibacillus salinus]|uniref:chromate transporter n=1 Tax=Caldalkalibacillus salinus TaxID=2803787 RepID=UPI001923D322|nr:chromate transporter [Caldalkalibacillus salinus]
MAESLITYWQLFIGFVKPGLFGFGGGPASIPFIEKEVVENYGWMTHDEFMEALALGNTLPGPITTKIAAIVGYKVGGVFGIVSAIGGMVIPTAVLVVILTTLYIKFKNISKIEGIVKVLRVVVIVFLLQVTWELGMKEMTNTMNIAIFGVAAVLIFVFHLHPLAVIGIAILFGVVYH